jgi:hypothetical protein
MEAVRTSETSVNFYQTIRRCNPEDRHPLWKCLVQKLCCIVIPCYESADWAVKLTQLAVQQFIGHVPGEEGWRKGCVQMFTLYIGTREHNRLDTIT